MLLNAFSLTKMHFPSLHSDKITHFFLPGIEVEFYWNAEAVGLRQDHRSTLILPKAKASIPTEFPDHWIAYIQIWLLHT